MTENKSITTRSIEAFGKLRFSVVLLIAGFILIIAGYYKIKDLTIVPIEEPDYTLIVIGAVIIAAAIITNFSLEKLRLGSKEEVTAKVEEITGRRFANLIFVYARHEKSIALGYHKGHKKHLPPGRRLELNEAPHEELINIVRDQIGLKLRSEDFVSPVATPDSIMVVNANAQTIGDTKICLSPVWVQLERHVQRPDQSKAPVSEHLDFVFLCMVDKARPLGPGVRSDLGWFSHDDLKKMITPGGKRETFPDVLRGFEAVEGFIEDRGLI